jgi:hypothetical protein
MLSLSDNDELDRVERLVEELKPIQEWDAAYWRNRYAEVHEKIAFVARRERRSEILPQPSSLFSGRTIQGKRPWTFTFKNPSAMTERKKRVAEHGLLQLRIHFVCNSGYIEQALAEIIFQYGCHACVGTGLWGEGLAISLWMTSRSKVIDGFYQDFVSL